MILPNIKFVPFNGKTLDDLVNYMQEHTNEHVFLVYLRCRYEHEDKWEYITDACCLCNYDDILWMSDWHEGQEYVEYLGITQISR